MTTVVEGIGALDSAIEIGGQYLPDDLHERAIDLRQRASTRQGVGDDVTVVAFAGATGAGKSSLVNALVGEDIAKVAPTRPTTSEPLAISSGDATDILDWLDIDRRHIAPNLAQRCGFAPDAGTLVLVDLPDIDSTQVIHRDIAHRLTERVDVVVWVLDPQKYADAVVHEDYLSALQEHADVTVVLLNQADRLDDVTLHGVISDANRLLRRDGIDTEVVATSAVTGLGLDVLRQRLSDFVTEKSVARAKLAADLRSVGSDLSQGIVPTSGKELSKLADFTPVARAFGQAAGVQTVAKAAGDSYLVRGRHATGWPLTRWMRGKIDPLKRLRLDRAPDNPDVAPATGLVVSSAKLTQARGELRRYVESETAMMPRSWAHDVQDSMSERSQSLLTDMDRILSTADLERGRRPAWWTVVNILQWILLLTALAGGIWLLLLGVADWLKLQIPDPPAVSIFPVPTIMLVLGLVLGWILTILAGAALKTGASRTQTRVEKRLTKEMTSAATGTVLQPLSDAKSRYSDFIQHVNALLKVRA